MAMSLMHDPEIRAIQWRDLVPMSRLKIIGEMSLTLPWLAAVLYCAHMHWWLPALGFSFVLFLAGLRNAHDGQHYNFGISRTATDVFMFYLSIVMCGSIHAVQVNHLRHHRYCLGEKDYEGKSARMKGWQAIVFGPVFFVMIHVLAWRHGNRKQRIWVVAETLTVLGYVWWVAFTRPGAVFEFHAATMVFGQCLTAFFAVWTVHHDLDLEKSIARTERGWRNKIFLGMFYHVEHHLFPRVPTPHLPKLAARLDEVRPDLNEARVLP